MVWCSNCGLPIGIIDQHRCLVKEESLIMDKVDTNIPVQFIAKIADRISFEQQVCNNETRPLTAYGIARMLWNEGFLREDE